MLQVLIFGRTQTIHCLFDGDQRRSRAYRIDGAIGLRGPGGSCVSRRSRLTCGDVGDQHVERNWKLADALGGREIDGITERCGKNPFEDFRSPRCSAPRGHRYQQVQNTRRGDEHMLEAVLDAV